MRRERWVSTSSIHEFDPGLGSILRVRLLGTRSTVRVHEPYPCLYPRYRCPASPSPRPTQRPRRLLKLVLALPSPTVVEKAGAAKSSPAAPIVSPVVPWAFVVAAPPVVLPVAIVVALALALAAASALPRTIGSWWGLALILPRLVVPIVVVE
jgi:hypothetical protein